MVQERMFGRQAPLVKPLLNCLSYLGVLLFLGGCNLFSSSPNSQSSLLQNPPNPFGVESVSLSGSALVVTWSASEGATSYSLYRRAGSRKLSSWLATVIGIRHGISLEDFTLLSSNATSPYTDNTVVSGQTYTYTVVASGLGGQTSSSDGLDQGGSAVSGQGTGTVGSPPGSFAISSAVAGNAQVVVIWGASTGSVSYTLKRGTTSGSYPTTVSTSATSPFTDTGLTNGTPYFYMVTAVNTSGTTNANAEASATPIAPPGSFAISSAVAGDAQVVVTWGASTGSVSYTLKRGTTSGSYPTTVSTSATSPFTDTGLTNGTPYFYMVTAVNTSGTTNANAEASATPIAPPGSFAISAATPGNAQIAVSWGASTNAASYTLKRGTTSGSYPTTVSTSATSPYTDTGLTNGTAYYYMVTAVNTSGTTDATAEATATPILSAYIADNSGHVYQCSLNSGGDFNTCSVTPSSGAPAWTPYGIALALVNGIQFAYVADIVGHVYQCSLKTDETFNSCSATPSSAAPSWNSHGLGIGTVNGSQYAYIGDQSGDHIYRCVINSDGTFSSCIITPASGAPAWTPRVITLATVSGTTYAYVTDFGSANLRMCTLNSDGTFNTCSTTPTSGAPGWSAYGISFATVSGTQYAYVSDTTGKVYQCTLNSNGTFNTCIITPSSGAPSWHPYGTQIASVNGTQYAYVADNLGHIYQCSLNVNGTLNTCSVTPSSGAPAWNPRGLAFPFF